MTYEREKSTVWVRGNQGETSVASHLGCIGRAGAVLLLVVVGLGRREAQPVELL